MLVANAGSGKTYELTTRIIRLLLAGVHIDRIAALTFTRKSAGEFLDELLLRIAQAAEDPAELEKLRTSTAQAGLTAADCCGMLEHIVAHFGRLGLSTIDSFFARIARQFPLESGLPEEFAIADNASLAGARERALAACFARATEGDEALQAMIEQCRQISRRHGERNVFGMLLDQIETLHQRYLETPEGRSWGDAGAIWPQGFPFAQAPSIEAAVEAFAEAAAAATPELSAEAQDQLDTQLDAIRQLEPGQAWSEAIQNFVFSKLIRQPKTPWLRLTAKKTGWLELTPEVQATRKALADALFADSLKQCLARSQGLYQFVRQYESVYAELIRSAGLISFADITGLLAERADDADTLDALDWRTQVAYRIDQQFDHWLLDEFQDTSRTQWTILRAFIDEVLMDDAARRSFFYVGDTKQAIYGWRGGDAELFREIFEHYRPAIEEAAPLTDSWRSTAPVIDMVNRVFGDVAAHAEALKLPEASVRKWQLAWNRHSVAEPIRDRVGYAAWHAVSPEPDDDSPPQYLEVLRILREVDPLSRGIECAVLTRQNKQVAELAARLQAEGIAVAVEGKANPCTDNLLGSAVLAALRAAAHPADTLSAGIARGLPCAEAWGLDDPDHFRRQTLQSIAEAGYAKTLQFWIERCALEDEAFLQSRSEALLAAAEDFDARRQDEGIDGFIAYVQSLEIQEAEASRAIRLMTVHQAKGLGFDMVIACGLDGRGAGHTADQLVLGPDNPKPEWGLLMPRKEIAGREPVLAGQAERLAAESKTNELCGAYVALTRAKQALYLCSDALKPTSKASHFGMQLKCTLEEDFRSGNPDWFLEPST